MRADIKEDRLMSRRLEGSETWHRLLEWDKGSNRSERLAGVVLSHDGFKEIDPIHPNGGRDGRKDLVLTHAGKRWAVSVYFPRGQKSFTEIRKKFKHDCGGGEDCGSGFIFFTNQELKLSERKELDGLCKCDVQLYHLERICLLLNTPSLYGVRYDFLEIEMSKAEQISFFAEHDRRIGRIEQQITRLFCMTEEQGRQVSDLIIDDDFLRQANRTIGELISAEREFTEKIWFDRHLLLKEQVDKGIIVVDPDIWEGAIKSAQNIIERYGEENLGPYSDYEWGMLNGKLSTLRWIMGDEWDLLDT